MRVYRHAQATARQHTPTHAQHTTSKYKVTRDGKQRSSDRTPTQAWRESTNQLLWESVSMHEHKNSSTDLPSFLLLSPFFAASYHFLPLLPYSLTPSCSLTHLLLLMKCCAIGIVDCKRVTSPSRTTAHTCPHDRKCTQSFDLPTFQPSVLS